jgi:hypothetical protein
MKMHKFEVHILDFEDYGPNEYKFMMDNLNFIGKVYHVNTADIGKWIDDHKLNRTNDIDIWNSYYDTTRKS